MQDLKTLLEIDLKAEQETIKNYRERIRQTESAGEFALSETLRHHRTRARSRNRLERCPRPTMIAIQFKSK
jgi:hypothetical protein